MKKKEQQEFTKKELQAIYDEFNLYVNQLDMLKPFFQNLIDVTNGAEPNYDLGGYFLKK
ncbi:MAG: hypothetical protein WCG95_05895 [bacterium]